MSAKFGDGYEQRSSIGLNPILPTWSLTFTGLRKEIDPIDVFLEARGGAESFQWKTPDEEGGLYVCRKWTKKREHGSKVTLQCELEKVSEPGYEPEEENYPAVST